MSPWTTWWSPSSPSRRARPSPTCARARRSASPPLEDITIYHKLAACDIAKGEPIVKYGEHIGLAARDIKAGEHVHCHNLEEHRENLDSKG